MGSPWRATFCKLKDGVVNHPFIPHDCWPFKNFYPVYEIFTKTNIF